jgi:tryptophan-rich sensory protein
MKNIIRFILCILFTVSIGAISGIATSDSLQGWFTELNKPVFNPPNYLLGPVWTVLYILMGISLYLVLKSPDSVLKKRAIAIFSLQLFLNFCWSFIFFKFQLPGVAFIEILLLWFAIIFMIISFYKINKLAAYLQIPYLLWVSFASVLNGAIWWLN